MPISNQYFTEGKPSSMPSTHTNDDVPYTYEAGKANDGIYLPSGHEQDSLAHTTASEEEPWWRVDLEQTHCVWAVRVLNRALSSQYNKACISNIS